MKTLVEALRLVSVSPDLDETLKAILDGLKSLVDYDAAGIYVIQPKTGELRVHTVQSYLENTSQFELIPRGKGVVGRVLEAGTPLLIDDVTSDPNYIEARPTTQSEIAVPIVGSGERITWVLNLESDVRNSQSSAAGMCWRSTPTGFQRLSIRRVRSMGQTVWPRLLLVRL